MANNRQIVIHYHTSGTTNPQLENVRFGEIVVRHNTDRPELIIKKDENTFATFIDSKAIENKLSVLKTDLEGQITATDNSAVSALTDFKAEVAETYATKKDVTDDIATAKNEAIGAASAYTDGKISTLSTNLSKDIDAVEADVATVSGALNTFKTTVANTYATQSSVSTDISAAKSEAIGAASAYTDSQISALNTNLGKDIDAVEADVATVSGALNTFKTEVANTYATKSSVSSDIANAKSEAIGTASAYTDGQISILNTNLGKDIDAVEADVATVSGALNTFKTEVANTYATKSSVSTDIANAKSEAIGTASAYTDGKISTLSTNLSKDIDAVEAKVDKLISGDTGKSVRNIAVEEVAKVVSGAPEAFDTLKEIADWIGAGSGATAAELVADIKNLKDADEQLGKDIDAVEADVATVSGALNTFKTEVANTYATKSSVSSDIANAKSEAIGTASAYTDGQISILNTNLGKDIDAVEADVATVSGALNTFKTTVANTYATKKDVTDDIATAKSEAIGAASAYTDSQISALNTNLGKDIDAVEADIATVSGALNTFKTEAANTYATKSSVSSDISAAKSEAIGTASAYTDGQISTLNTNLGKDIDAVEARVATLEGLTGKTNSAIQTITISNLSGVSKTYSGTATTIDFAEMVIDCGEF